MRLSETGPYATGFWRGALALPFLALWAYSDSRVNVAGRPPVLKWDSRFFWAGFFFAGDLALWHWSLLLTSIAASTLEVSLAPIIVTLFAWLAWRERPRPLFLVALGFALVGVFLIVSPNLVNARRAFIGDLLGLGTAVFYAGYLIVVSRLRGTYSAGTVMFWSTLIFTALLFPLALTQQFLPHSTHGWMLLLGLALTSQFLGQGLITYALAHLSATFGSFGLYLQPVAAAFYAWWLLGERLMPIQFAGAAAVLTAIALARASKQNAAG